MGIKTSLIPSGKKIRERAKKTKDSQLKLLKKVKENLQELRHGQEELREKLQESHSRVYELVGSAPALRRIFADQTSSAADLADDIELIQSRGQKSR